MKSIGRWTYIVVGTMVIVWLAACMAELAEAKGGGSGGGGGAAASSGGKGASVSSGASSGRTASVSSNQSSSAASKTVSATKGGTGYASSNGKTVTSKNGVVTKTGTHSARTGLYTPTRDDRYAYRSDVLSPWFILWATDHGWEEDDLNDSSEAEAALAQYNAEIDEDAAVGSIKILGIVMAVLIVAAAIAIVIFFILAHRSEKRLREQHRGARRGRADYP